MWEIDISMADDTTVPCNTEAEQGVIGAVLLGPEDEYDSATEAFAALTSGDFYYGAHRLIFAAMEAVNKDGGAPDAVLTAAELVHRKQFEDVGGWEYLKAVMWKAQLPQYVGRYAKIVREASLLRKLARIGEDTTSAALEEVSEFPLLITRTIENLVYIRQKAGTEERYMPLSTETILADTSEAPPDLVGNFIPGACVIQLSGTEGIGKSYAVLHLCLAVARGEPWLGFETRQVPVLMFDVENRRIRVNERLKKLGARPSDPLWIAFDTRYKLDTDSFVVDVISLAQSLDAGLIVFDSQVDFLGRADENSNSDMGQLAHRARDVTEATGASIIFIHHVPKESAGRDWQTARGASAFPAGMDVCCQIIRREKVLRFQQSKNRVAEPVTFNAKAIFTADSYDLALMGDIHQGASRSINLTDVSILDLLSDNQWHPSNEVKDTIMKTTGLTERTVRKHLAELRERRLIVTDPPCPLESTGKSYLIRTAGLSITPEDTPEVSGVSGVSPVTQTPLSTPPEDSQTTGVPGSGNINGEPSNTPTVKPPQGLGGDKTPLKGGFSPPPKPTSGVSGATIQPEISEVDEFEDDTIGEDIFGDTTGVDDTPPADTILSKAVDTVQSLVTDGLDIEVAIYRNSNAAAEPWSDEFKEQVRGQIAELPETAKPGPIIREQGIPGGADTEFEGVD